MMRTLACSCLFLFATAAAASPSHGGHCHGDKCSTAAKTEKLPSSFDKMPPEGTKVTCAVSGEEFAINKSTLTSTYNGRVYVFCCAGCKSEFDAAPQKFVK